MGWLVGFCGAVGWDEACYCCTGARGASSLAETESTRYVLRYASHARLRFRAERNGEAGEDRGDRASFVSRVGVGVVVFVPMVPVFLSVFCISCFVLSNIFPYVQSASQRGACNGT